MLSDESPIRPNKSIIFSGGTPHFSFTPTLSYTLISACLPDGAYRKILSLTNCIKSLSPLTMYESNSFKSACLTKVPIMSSASNPGFSIVGILIALNNFHR